MKSRRTVLMAVAVAAAATLTSAPTDAHAQTFPGKPITIIYPYAGGSASDLLTRQVGEWMGKALGQPVIVESRPGAGGSTALEQATRAPADGHTLVLTASGTMAVNPHIYRLKYDPLADLTPIAILVEIPFIAVSNLTFAGTDLKRFIETAKARPGAVSFGNAGIGTQANLTQVMFMRQAGITANIVPYKGGAAMTTDLLGNHLDAAFDNAAAQVANVKAGKVRPLFVTTRERTASLPDVPTAVEAGLPGFVQAGWFGLAAPKGTPRAVVERINRILTEAFARPENHKYLIEAGWTPALGTPEQAAQRARSDHEQLGAVVRALGLQPN